MTLLALAVLFLVSTFGGGATGTPVSSDRGVIVRVDPNGRGPYFAQGAIGLSTETFEFGAHHLSATNRTRVRLMRLLGPAVLRIGGNESDESWWTSHNESHPSWATNVVTPTDLVRLRGLLDATHWRVILGVNLGHFDPSRAADEARFATLILGPTLLGFEVGNEPAGYVRKGLRPTGYTVSDYLDQLGAYTRAMRATAAGLRLYGPDLARPDWLATIAAAHPASLVELTRHFWPTNYNIGSTSCPRTSVPAAQELLSLKTRAREREVLGFLLAVAARAGRPARVDETNTTSSCDTPSAPDTNSVFAGALWSFDWALRAASQGVAGMNFHGAFRGCLRDTFGPFCIAAVKPLAVVRPEYYGLFAARQLEGGHFIPARVLGAPVSRSISAYATLRPNGDIKLAVVNFALNAAAAVSVEALGYTKASEETLGAPSIEARSGVRFGGGSFNDGGKLADRATALRRAKRGFVLRAMPTTAYVITLHPGR